MLELIHGDKSSRKFAAEQLGEFRGRDEMKSASKIVARDIFEFSATRELNRFE
ncbi:MAG: hypothetical protein NVS9B14_01810 [Candidatus Acidiferrum sp.]